MEMLEFENTSALDIALAEKVVAMLAADIELSLIHISEPTRRTPISYAVFCLKKEKRSIS